jgi:hypothetical protein
MMVIVPSFSAIASSDMRGAVPAPTAHRAPAGRVITIAVVARLGTRFKSITHTRFGENELWP